MFSVTRPRPDPIITHVEIDSKELLMEVDTGVTLSVISEHWRNTTRPKIKATKDSLRTYTGQYVKINGVVTKDATINSGHVIRGFSPSIRFTVFQFANRGLFQFLNSTLLFRSVYLNNDERKSRISNEVFFEDSADFSQSHCFIPLE